MVLAKLKTRSLLSNRRADCTKYAYDTEGKTIGWKYQDQTRATQAYDAVGQRTKIQDWTGRYTYSFDAVGRTLLASDSFAKRITYAYDAVGQRAKMREPDGGRFTYWYDGVGQITRLLNPFQENTTFTYDVAGRRTMQKLANRVRASYSYDAADRLTTLANVRADGTYVSKYDYAYDNTMNKTRVIEADADRVTWSYDTTYQLTRERRSGANAYDTTYTYDAAQNRRLMIDSGARTTYTCDAVNQLNWFQDNSGRTTFSYDNNGNQTLQIDPTLTRTTNLWDGNNCMVRVIRGSSINSTYLYDSSRRMVESSLQGDVSHFTLDRYDCLIDTDISGATYAAYTNDISMPFNLLCEQRGASRYYHGDSVGSIRQITNGIGTTSEVFNYSAFGSSLSSSGMVPLSFRFGGGSGFRYIQADYYSQGKWYDPIIAIWKSLPYAFNSNNPIGISGEQWNGDKQKMPPIHPDAICVELYHIDMAECRQISEYRKRLKCEIDAIRRYLQCLDLTPDEPEPQSMSMLFALAIPWTRTQTTSGWALNIGKCLVRINPWVLLATVTVTFIVYMAMTTTFPSRRRHRKCMQSYLECKDKNHDRGPLGIETLCEACFRYCEAQGTWPATIKWSDGRVVTCP